MPFKPEYQGKTTEELLVILGEKMMERTMDITTNIIEDLCIVARNMADSKILTTEKKQAWDIVAGELSILLEKYETIVDPSYTEAQILKMGEEHIERLLGE